MRYAIKVVHTNIYEKPWVNGFLQISSGSMS